MSNQFTKDDLVFENLTELHDTAAYFNGIVSTVPLFQGFYSRLAFTDLQECATSVRSKKDCQTEINDYIESTKYNPQTTNQLFKYAQQVCQPSLKSFLACTSQHEGLYAPCTQQFRELSNCLAEHAVAQAAFNYHYLLSKEQKKQ